MQPRRRVRRLIPMALAATAAIALMACGPPTAEELLGEAQEAFQRRDAVETELRLQRVLAKEQLDVSLAVEAHMLRAMNFIMLMGDLEQGRAEFEAILEIVPVNSDEGTIAAMRLADIHLASGDGLERFQEELDQHLAQLEPRSSRALNLNVHRWEVLTDQGASRELEARHPALMAQIASCEDLTPNARCDISLQLTLAQSQMAKRQEQWENAIEALEIFIAGFPDSDPARFMAFEVAALLRELDRDDEADQVADAAFEVLEQRLTSLPSSSEQATVAYSIADAHLILGDIETASREYAAVFDTYLDYQHRGQAMLGWAESLRMGGYLDAAGAYAVRAALEYPGTRWNATAEQLLQRIAADQASAEEIAETTPAAPVSPEEDS